MRIRVNNTVFSAEGHLLGRLKYLLIDQNTLQLGGLVVQHRRWLIPIKETLIPAHLCWPTILDEVAGTIQLDCSARQFETLPSYWDYQGQESDENITPTWLHCNPEAFFIYHPSQPYNDTKRVRNCHAELVQLGNAAQVLLSDGGRGRIREFFFGSEPGKPMPQLLSLSASCPNQANPITLPASWLHQLEDERAILKMNRAELHERLTWPNRLAALLVRVRQE